MADRSLTTNFRLYHRKQVAGKFAGWDLQIAFCGPQRIETFVLAVNEHSGGPMFLEHGLAEQLRTRSLARQGPSSRQLGCGPRAFPGIEGKADLSWPAADDVTIDALRFHVRLEDVVKTGDRFRGPQKEDAIPQ